MITAVPRSRVGLPGELVSSRAPVEFTAVERAEGDVMGRSTIEPCGGP